MKTYGRCTKCGMESNGKPYCEICKRKKELDQIMREYYYEKNDIETTVDFLQTMFIEYAKIIKKGEIYNE